MNKIILIILMLMSVSTFGAEVSVGRIVEIKGSAFISRNGKTKEINKGDQVYVNSEIVVEHSGQVTYTDNADHRYHFGNASSALVGINFVELRAGDVWFQSLNKTENYQVKTVNALVDYQGGEAILSYDSTKSKSQLMVINGIMKLSNLGTPELNLNVAEGNFSFVDINYESGAPRDPTPVGEKTYKLLVGMFPGVAPMDKKSETIFAHEQPKREIASVHEVAHAEAKKEIKIIPKSEAIESYTEQMLKKTVTVKKVISKSKMPKAQILAIHIYGLKKAKNSEGARMPASVKEEPAPSKVETKINSRTEETDKLLQALDKL